MKFRKIMLALLLLLPLTLHGRSVDEEIIVFFKPDVIHLPEEQDSALMNAIEAPRKVLDLLHSVNVIKISKALPDFKAADTLRVTNDGRKAQRGKKPWNRCSSGACIFLRKAAITGFCKVLGWLYNCSHFIQK